MTNIKVRPLLIDDFGDVREVDEQTQYQYLGEKWKQLSFEEKEKHLVTRESDFKANVETEYGFVALADDELVGFVLAHENLPFADSVYIRHIAIKPKWQGHDIGSQLLNAVIEKAKEKGIAKIWSMINLDNLRSMKLHEKLGFALKDRKEAVSLLNR